MDGKIVCSNIIRENSRDDSRNPPLGIIFPSCTILIFR